MREFGKISPMFWIGDTGRSLRGNLNAQILALYLISCPTSHMTGVFYCPLVSMAHETGIDLQAPSKPHQSPLEGVKKALNDLEKGGFCYYDYDSEWIFVFSMAKFQIGDSLKASDKQVKGIKNHLESVPKLLRNLFIQRYSEAFNLGLEASPLEAPCKPLRSQETEKETEKEKEKETYTHPSPAARTASVSPTRGPAIQKPEGVESEDWQAYLKLRKQKRLPLTQRALDSMLAEADKVSMTPQQMIVCCLEHSWASFRADWYEKEQSEKPFDIDEYIRKNAASFDDYVPPESEEGES